jgi:hypothetical protein
MSDDKQAPPAGPVRVIDKRSFASDGTRREPDAIAEEVLPHAAPAKGQAAAPVAPAGKATAAGPEAAASPLFQNLVVNLARQAAANLGASRHPISGQIESTGRGATDDQADRSAAPKRWAT